MEFQELGMKFHEALPPPLKNLNLIKCNIKIIHNV